VTGLKSSNTVQLQTANNATSAKVQSAARRTFIMQYSYAGYLPKVKQQISDMAMNGSGIRDTARVLHISPTTVIEELKKGASSQGSESS